MCNIIYFLNCVFWFGVEYFSWLYENKQTNSKDGRINVVSLCVTLYLWAHWNLPPAADRFLWQTEVDGFFSRCPSLSPPAGKKLPSFTVTHSLHKRTCISVWLFCVVPARTSGSACCFLCNACRWCSSASQPNRSPASHTASAAADKVTFTV